MTNALINSTNLASVLGVSNATVRSWISCGKISPVKKDSSYSYFDPAILPFPELKQMSESSWEAEEKITPVRKFNSIELFAGAGGLALGLHEAGFNQILMNEFDHDACETLRKNFKDAEIVEGDVHDIDFSPYKGKIDFLSGGFPCQAFSYAGNQKGFDDARGTLFFELARAIKETQPKVFLGENVKGLVSHDGGKTFKVISQIIDELGYYLVPPRVLKAVMYKVPQKRERIFLVGIRKDLADKVTFHWPSPYTRVMTLRDAFYKGELYDCDVPESIGQKYPKRKAEILSKVPQGGDWRDLPEDLQKEYMKGSFYLGGGKTGMARRLSLDEPSLTLTCAPAQKQTERCHPIETRPLTVREYARIQTFPDSWEFAGSELNQYKQIGNAVPVNLAKAMGHSLIWLLNDIEKLDR
ncbi:MAG: DNA (cytosine-5-)-methyltransferase [Treponema sp.]|nr:DNA (cytosine-5-)-methyltransferase [Treponema sp.]